MADVSLNSQPSSPAAACSPLPLTPTNTNNSNDNVNDNGNDNGNENKSNKNEDEDVKDSQLTPPPSSEEDGLVKRLQKQILDPTAEQLSKMRSNPYEYYQERRSEVAGERKRRSARA